VNELRVMNADGSNNTVLLSRTSAFITHPAWSPDLDGDAANGYQGALAVSIENEPDPGTDLFLLDVSVAGGVPVGTNLRKIVEDDLDPNVWNIAVHADWSADLDPLSAGYQGRIVFTGSPDGTAGNVNTIDVAWDGTSVEPVNGPNSSVNIVPNTGSILPFPTWSPDGASIAFAGTTTAGSGIHVIDSVTGAVQKVISTGLGVGHEELQWSNHDSRIAFRHSSTATIYTIDVDQGASSLAAVIAGGFRPDWSPNDAEIVYGIDGTIRSVDLSSGQSVLLASDSRKRFINPAWRPF
jgi:hypothetical protein